MTSHFLRNTPLETLIKEEKTEWVKIIKLDNILWRTLNLLLTTKKVWFKSTYTISYK